MDCDSVVPVYNGMVNFDLPLKFRGCVLGMRCDSLQTDHANGHTLGRIGLRKPMASQTGQRPREASVFTPPKDQRTQSPAAYCQ